MARRKYPRPVAALLFRPLDADGPAPLNDQLARRLEAMIADGRLRPDDYLPPIRLLAAKLGVSPTTVVGAYDILRTKSLVASSSTRGLRVLDTEPSAPPARMRAWAEMLAPPALPSDPLTIELPSVSGDPVIRLDVAEPPPAVMPRNLLERAYRTILRDGDCLRYGSLDGAPAVIDAVRGYLSRRGVATDDSALILTSGTTQSLAILTRALVSPGGLVLVEQPTWHVALSVFAAARARVLALPVDDDGVRPQALTDVVMRHNPAFLYLQPAFQNPTGVTLSPTRRAELLDVARRLHLLVVEDDFASELAFGDTPAPLRTDAAADVVVHLKSFAKVLSPALRIGAVVAPLRVATPLRSVKHGLDPFVSLLAQHVLAEALSSPDLPRHVRRLAAHLRTRWEVLEDALRRHALPGMRWTTPAGGFATWLELPDGVSAAAVTREAAARAVAVLPGTLFSLDDTGDRALRLAFGGVAVDQIETGVKRLGEAVAAAMSRSRGAERRMRAVAP